MADDHGRFDAHPVTVKARCFPTLVDALKTSKVCAWLTELSIDHCLFYQVAGRAYGQFRKWAEYQRTYSQKSKFPEPPVDSGESPENPALIRDPISEIRESGIDIRESVKPTSRTRQVSEREQKLGELESLVLDEDVQSWAQCKFHVVIPEDVLEEFKAYWREQRKLRTDWTATLKSRVRQLVARGILKPERVSQNSHRPTKVVL